MKWLSNVLQKWRSKQERRKAPRQAAPLVAYYWSGGNPSAHTVQNVSRTGAFVRTAEMWGLGTVLQLHLCEEETGTLFHSSTSFISVMATVVRQDADGMGINFLFPSPKRRHAFDEYMTAVVGRREGQAMLLKGLASERGGSLVEFALLIPLLFLLIVNTINFGSFIFAWITVANASRSASHYAAMAGASINAPRPASASQIYTVVTQDMSSLLNRSSLAVRVCTNRAGTVACTTTGTGTFTNPPNDTRTEANLFVMGWVDVLYTYQPLIPLFNFPGLGIHATLPPTRIHRQTVMRMLQ
ncbi:MAG: PilZ domain-containing protein [Bryobacteraceae bacterium]